MSEHALVADTSVLIHFMEGHPEAGRRLMGREVHISVATEIELRTMGAIKRNAKEVIDRTLAMCSIWDISPSIKEQCIHLRSTYRLISFRSKEASRDAPLFFRRAIRGVRCVAVSTGRTTRRSNVEKEQADRMDPYCETVLSSLMRW